MIGLIARSAGVPPIVAWVAFIGIAFAGLWGYGAWQYAAGKAEGVRVERVAWEEARQRLLARLEAERRAAQASIDKVERDYFAAQARASLQISDLETELAKMEAADHEAHDNPDCACRPALPRGLGLRLDQVGR